MFFNACEALASFATFDLIKSKRLPVGYLSVSLSLSPASYILLLCLAKPQDFLNTRSTRSLSIRGHKIKSLRNPAVNLYGRYLFTSRYITRLAFTNNIQHIPILLSIASPQSIFPRGFPTSVMAYKSK